MIDDELEQHLRAHYRNIDPVRAPGDLGGRIEDAIDRRPNRPAFIVRARPVFAIATAAVLIVAVGLGLRPGGFLSPAGTSPSASIPPAATPSPTSTAPVPSGSLPPVSPVAWTGISLQAVDGGPVGISSIVRWAGGYIALGEPSDSTPLPAWTSGDGRTWTALPPRTFGLAADAMAAPIPGGVIVAVQGGTGQTTVYRSMDGLTWTSNAGPQPLGLSRDLAGNGTGAVGIDAASPDRVQFTADGIGWQSVALPATTPAQIKSVAAFGSGFVAVGADGTTTRSPVAWWSNDGLQWTQATVADHPGDGFVAVYAAHDGLMALSSTGDVPGLTSFWTSPDGRSWAPSAADPLGVVTEGEGQGSANGIFSGDGTRLLGYGTGGTDPTSEWWTSMDATDWTRLAITGQTTATSIADLQPFLEQDGILFNSGQTSWFGVAVP